MAEFESLSLAIHRRREESKSGSHPLCECCAVCVGFIIVHSGLLETWSRRARYVIAYKIIGVHLNRRLMATRFALNGHAAWISHFQLQLFQQRTAPKVSCWVNSARVRTYTRMCVCPGNNQWRDSAKCDFWEIQRVSARTKKESRAWFTFNISTIRPRKSAARVCQ